MSTQATFDSQAERTMALQPGTGAAAAASGVRRPDVRLSLHHDLAAIEGQWRELEARADCTVFQTFDWLSTWQRNIGARNGVMPAIVIGRLDGQAMLLLPLAVEPGGLVRRVTWLGSYLSNYNGPVLARDFSRRLDLQSFEAVWRDVKALLAEGLAVDLIDLEKMPESIGEQINPFCSLWVTPHVNDAYLTTLSGDWESYYAGKRSSATRKTDRKKRKRLAENGDIQFITAAVDGDIEGTVDALIEQKAKAYAKLGVENMFGRPGYRDFFLDLARDPRSRPLAHVSRFDVGAVTAAANYGLIFGGRYYYILAGYDDGELARHGPGSFQLQELLRYAIERRLRQFDFTIGDEPYKREWSDTETRLFDHVAPVTWRGWLAAGPIIALRLFKRRVKRTPAAWSLVRKLRASLGSLRR